MAGCDVLLQTGPVPFDILGLPELTLPIGFTAIGPDPKVPVGTIIGRTPYEEDRLLDVAAAYQAVTYWHTERLPDPVLPGTTSPTAPRAATVAQPMSRRDGRAATVAQPRSRSHGRAATADARGSSGHQRLSDRVTHGRGPAPDRSPGHDRARYLPRRHRPTSSPPPRATRFARQSHLVFS
jgi:hypothetical protein